MSEDAQKWITGKCAAEVFQSLCQPLLPWLSFFVLTQFSFHILPHHLSICQFLFVSLQILDCGQCLSCRTSNCTHGQHFIWPQAKKTSAEVTSPAHTLFYLYLCTLYQQRHYSTNFLLSGVVKNCVCQ